MPVLMYSSETMILRKRSSLGLGLYRWTNSEVCWVSRRMDKVPNARIRQLCRVMKGLEDRIDEGVLQWFDHVERMENDRIGKRVYVGVCAGSHSLGILRKRWINTVKVFLKKRCLDVRQARRMVHDWGIHGDEPMTLTRSL